LPLGNMVGRVPDEHQCRKFMGAEHSCLLVVRVGAGGDCAGYWPVGRACPAQVAFGDALPVARLAAIGSGESMVGADSGAKQSGSSRILDILRVFRTRNTVTQLPRRLPCASVASAPNRTHLMNSPLHRSRWRQNGHSGQCSPSG
jgi:hypothetical protein